MDYGVSIVFINLLNIKIEFFELFGDDLLIVKFLEKNLFGGIYYVCYEVDDIIVVWDKLVVDGVWVLGMGELKIGVYGKLVLFLYFKDFLGMLMELEEV